MSEKENNEISAGTQASVGKKVDTTLVPYEAICAIAAALQVGAEKYGKDNWRKGLPENEVLSSIDRHLRATMAGEYRDLDTKLPHSWLMLTRAAMYVAADMSKYLPKGGLMTRAEILPGTIAAISSVCQEEVLASLEIAFDQKEEEEEEEVRAAARDVIS